MTQRAGETGETGETGLSDDENECDDICRCIYLSTASRRVATTRRSTVGLH